MNIRLVSTTLLGAVSGAVVAATAAPHGGVLLWVASALLAGAVCAALAPHEGGVASSAGASDEALRDLADRLDDLTKTLPDLVQEQTQKLSRKLEESRIDIAPVVEAIRAVDAGLSRTSQELSREIGNAKPDLSGLEAAMQANGAVLSKLDDRLAAAVAAHSSDAQASRELLVQNREALTQESQAVAEAVRAIPVLDLGPVLAKQDELLSAVSAGTKDAQATRDVLVESREALAQECQAIAEAVRVRPALDLAPVVSGLDELKIAVSVRPDAVADERPLAALEALRIRSERDGERSLELLAEISAKFEDIRDEFTKLGGTLISQTMSLEGLREEAGVHGKRHEEFISEELQKLSQVLVGQAEALELAIAAIRLEAPAASSSSSSGMDTHAFTALAQSLDNIADSLPTRLDEMNHRLSEGLGEAVKSQEESLQRVFQALSAVDPLAEHLASHGAQLESLTGHLETAGSLLSDIPEKLEGSVRTLEESLSTLRANQTEFAASVEVFTGAAEALSGKVCADAGTPGQTSMDGLVDHKAFLDALGRVLSGFSQSLQGVLAESSQRTQDVLVELCARIDSQEGK